jgi:hypothetical protein
MERKESTIEGKGCMLVGSKDHMAMGKNCRTFFLNFFTENLKNDLNCSKTE